MSDYDKRLERVEDKVDEIKDSVGELRSDFRVHKALIEEHVAGDKKIINEIQPMIQQFRLQQEKKINRMKNAKHWATIISIFTGTIAIITAAVSAVASIFKG